MSLSRINSTFLRAFKKVEQRVFLAASRNQFGTLIEPMLEIARVLLDGSPLLFDTTAKRPTRSSGLSRRMVLALLRIDTSLSTLSILHRHRGVLGLPRYRGLWVLFDLARITALSHDFSQSVFDLCVRNRRTTIQDKPLPYLVLYSAASVPLRSIPMFMLWIIAAERSRCIPRPFDNPTRANSLPILVSV